MEHLGTKDGESLHPEQRLSDVGIQSHDVLTAVYVSLPRLAATTQAFAAWRPHDMVCCWGQPDAGGECRGIQNRLVDVVEIQATRRAFSAILADGQVQRASCFLTTTSGD